MYTFWKPLINMDFKIHTRLKKKKKSGVEIIIPGSPRVAYVHPDANEKGKSTQGGSTETALASRSLRQKPHQRQV